MNTKNIVITGGTDGIGLAIVKNLLKENNKIFIIGNNSKKGDNVIKTLNSQNIEFYQCNLLERNEIEKLVKELSKLNKKLFFPFWYQHLTVSRYIHYLSFYNF